LTPSISEARKYPRPKRHDVYSPNRAYVLDVNPDTEEQKVYAAQDRTKALWSFSCRVWHGPFYLSNDGKVVAEVQWYYVDADALGTGNCIVFRSKAGPVKSYRFADLCPDPRRRGWLEGGPLRGRQCVWYARTSQEGDTVSVETTDLYEYTFSLAT